MKKKLSLTFLFLLMSLCLWPFDVSPSRDFLQSPSVHHWLGTDSLGRDLLARVIQGSGVSLLIGILTAIGSFFIATGVALFSLGCGGKIDQAISRLIEILMALPNLVLLTVAILALRNFFVSNEVETQIFILSMALISCSWMSMSRQMRTILGAELVKPYVESAQAIGSSSMRILFRHVFINVTTPALVLIGLQIPNHLLFESYLSFVGLGVQPPTASWGVLIQEGWKTLSQYPHLILVPSAFLFSTVFCFNSLFEDFID